MDFSVVYRLSNDMPPMPCVASIAIARSNESVGCSVVKFKLRRELWRAHNHG